MNATTLQPASLADPRPRYSQGIVVEGGRLVFIAGQIAADASGAVVGRGDIEAQTERVFENIGAVLAEAGGGFEHLVMTTTYLTDISQRAAFQKVRNRYFRPERPPTSTLVVVKSLATEDYLVEIAGIAVIP